ncbi:MAG TPA: hypothetical protein PK977_17545 [Chitinophagaceae bacterium]|nr:hypothetical protein [Chitinophagaceae bacterium]
MKFLLLVSFFCCAGVQAQQKTYCNPINIDYGYTPIPNFTEWGKHRATADPVIVNYKNDFYLSLTKAIIIYSVQISGAIGGAAIC